MLTQLQSRFNLQEFNVEGLATILYLFEEHMCAEQSVSANMLICTLDVRICNEYVLS